VTSCQQVRCLQAGNKQCEHILLTSCWNSIATSLQTSSYKTVHKLSSHCLFPVVVTSLKQAVDNLYQAWRHYQTCYKVVLTSLIQSRYNNNVTRLTTQGCNNTVVTWLYRTCWNNLAKSLIISTRLLTALFQTCWQLGTSSACDHNLLADLLQDVRSSHACNAVIARVPYTRFRRRCRFLWSSFAPVHFRY
jgi:hypothetical protein